MNPAVPPAPMRRDGAGRGLSRPQAIAETLKDWIVEQGMTPGDRLPQEAQLIQILGASKGTVREALRVLETQGLIRTRTGPGGGAFITEVQPDHAASLLANLFYFRELSLENVLQMRRLVGPELAADLARALSDAEISALEEALSPPPPAETQPGDAPAEAQETPSRLDDCLARRSPNTLMGFSYAFVSRLLHEHLEPGATAAEAANGAAPQDEASWTRDLIASLRAHDVERAREVMARRLDSEDRALIAAGARLRRGFIPPLSRR